ncbi:unnamed protein product [Cyclocybe aegerita]|uniref:Uncharacterized protein n=1 Tax=Cyclocybe aegerita TaxID=1973307 RepID=A0A8S0W9R2_CYCAE|nr:unnamed protein product [Cyclocybe aegerita]
MLEEVWLDQMIITTREEGEFPETEVDGRPVTGGMKVNAPTAPQSATTCTSAQNAGVQGTLSAAVLSLQVTNKCQSHLPIWSACPSFACAFIWNNNDGPHLTLTISSLFMPALPPVPDNELVNEPALNTIACNPDLFQVVTPISVSNLCNLLVNHPNNLFIDSICHGLLHGFWPWADTSCFNLPFILDVKDTVSDPVHLYFVYEQRDIEVSLGCFLQPFLHLLPGMLAIPFNVATKPHSDKLCLCFNYSAQPFLCNEMIPKELVLVSLDNLQDLGHALQEVHIAGGSSTCLMVWKSDIKCAYQNIPMHPLWQIKQLAALTTSTATTILVVEPPGFMGHLLCPCLVDHYICQGSC